MISAPDDAGDWTQDGAFIGSDGRPVRCYDDVILERSIAVEGGVRTDVPEVPAGTTGTVLFYTLGARPVAQLECDVEGGGFTFGFEELSHLKLHMTNEEKYGHTPADAAVLGLGRGDFHNRRKRHIFS